MTHTIRRHFAFIVLAFTLHAPQQAVAQDISTELATSRPTPCLDDIMPVVITEAIQVGADAVVLEIGRDAGLSPNWAPQHKAYIEARTLVSEAFLKDQNVNGPWIPFAGKDYLATVLSRATAEEQKIMQGHFGTRAGKLFWDYMYDGAVCESFIEQSAERGVLLTEKLKSAVMHWTPALKSKEQAFNDAKAQLDDAQIANFIDCFQMGRRFLLMANSDLMEEFQPALIKDERVQAAIARSLAPIKEELNALVNAHKQAATL